MKQAIYLFRGIEVVLTGRQAVKTGKSGNVLQTMVEVKPVNSTMPDWTCWTTYAELFTLIEEEVK